MKYPEQAASAVEAFAANVSAKAPVAGGLWTFVSVLTSSQAGVLAGIVGVVGGLLMNWYFKRREDTRQRAEDRRKQERHGAYMRKMAADSAKAPLDQSGEDD